VHIATNTPAEPFTFVSELEDGQVFIDPSDRAVRTVAGEPTGQPHDRVRITCRDGVELLLWRHTPVDLIDMDQLHEQALAEYQTHYAGRDGHRAAYQKLTEAELSRRVTGEGIAGRVGGRGYRKTVALDELHGRALAEHAGDIEPDLRARIAQLSIEELNMMVFGAWTDQVKAAVLDKLHARALEMPCDSATCACSAACPARWKCGSRAVRAGSCGRVTCAAGSRRPRWPW
jgi:hypothetical protein